ncbi:hypothetical protein [Cytobacillus oceanisediminis]|uniref:hypothetical protein n=1 Tax=Cytobacillus oceanisediminis TaxID=665099 RepID=UPI003734F733
MPKQEILRRDFELGKRLYRTFRNPLVVYAAWAEKLFWKDVDGALQLEAALKLAVD